MNTRLMRTLIGLLILAGAVFILHTVAMDRYLYWYFWWYDIMMHFLGGVLIGGMVLWGALRVRFDLPRSRLLMVTLVGIIIVGIGWEVFEYTTGTFIGESDLVADTTYDLIADILGAVLAWSLIAPAVVERDQEKTA